MGVSFASVLQDEMGLTDGSKRDGLMLGNGFVSYFQIEAALLEDPRILEAGVVSVGAPKDQYMKIYVAIDMGLAKETVHFLCREIQNFVLERFAVNIPVLVELRDKLPMTRSGKILRSVLHEWN